MKLSTKLALLHLCVFFFLKHVENLSVKVMETLPENNIKRYNTTTSK